MKITSVTIDTGPELSQKLWDYARIDKNCGAAWTLLHWYGFDQSDLEITPKLAEDWCRDWFGADAMLAYQETDWLQEPEDPDCCADPVIKEFVNAILGIYRLCQTV